MSYKPSQQLIDILLNAGFKVRLNSASVKPTYKTPQIPLLYRSSVSYAFKRNRMLIKFDRTMIEVSYKDKPVYKEKALSEDQLRSILFYIGLSTLDRAKVSKEGFTAFDMPTIIKKVKYFTETLHSCKYFGYHELIARYERIVVPPPSGDNP